MQNLQPRRDSSVKYHFVPQNGAPIDEERFLCRGEILSKDGPRKDFGGIISFVRDIVSLFSKDNAPTTTYSFPEEKKDLPAN